MSIERKLKFISHEGAEKYLKFRVSTWFDANTMSAAYGVEAQVRLGIWAHIAHLGSPLIFREKHGAVEEVARLRKSKAEAA